jgi:hypothetical protein
MKSLKAVRDEDFTPITKPVVVEAADDAADQTDDAEGNALLALNHMAVISDDLYTAIGEDGINLDPDEIDSILNSYDIIAALHEKYASSYDMPSDDFDGQDFSDEMEEELKLQKEEFILAEEVAWQMMVKKLKELGFVMMEPSAQTYKPANKEIIHMFGIPMRAGKFADTYFVIYLDEPKPYGIVNDEGVVAYAELGQALTALKKLTETGKLQEALAEDAKEPDKFVPGPWDIIEALGDDTTVRRLSKIKEGGFVGLAEEAIIVDLLAENAEDPNLFKAISDASAEIIEGVITPEWKRAVNKLGKVAAEKAAAERRYQSANTENNKRVLDAAIADVAKAQARLADIKSKQTKKEEVELDEGNLIDMNGKSCAKCDGKYKDNAPDGEVRCDKCGTKAKRWQNEIPTSKTKGGKKILSALKKEDADLTENAKNSVLTWDTLKGSEDRFRLEVIGQDGSVVARILDKVLPAGKGNVYDDQLGFKSTAERDKASAALVKYFKTVRESNVVEVPLGDLTEAFDETKFKRLAATGLVPAEDVNGVVRAMKVLEAGKVLSPAQKDLISNTFVTLIGLVTGDTAVFSKIQSAAKKGKDSE